jgi:hypothetical protein
MSGIGKKLSDFRQSQAVLYNEVAPNVIPSRPMDNGLAIPSNIGPAVTSYNPYNNKFTNDHPNISKYFVPAHSAGPDIRAQQDLCANSTIDQLIHNQNPRAPTCGWLYRSPPTDNSPYPRYSKGVLNVAGNTPPPPIFNRPDGTTLYTDLNEAKKVIETETCRALKSCDGIDNAPYKGMCGFSLWKGYGIPINSDGTAKYNDDRFYTPAAQIVTTSSKCPKPQEDAPDGQPAPPEEFNVCKQLPNKSLSRDCLLQQIRNSGCDNKGSLYQALAASTNPDNYASKLQGIRAYAEYQKRAMTANKPILSEVLLRSGVGTQADALNTFNSLYENAIQLSEKTAMGTAARDLCLNAGLIDSFDFCSELVDSTPMLGVELDCIQKEWRRRGGTPSGQWYPTSVTPVQRQFAKWGDYRKYLDKVFAGLDSSDMSTRAQAFLRTMGVKLMNESNIVPSIRNNVGCRMTTEIGVDRAGGQDIQVIDTGDYQVCQKACCDNPRCTSFTHRKDLDGGKCYLKRYPTKAVAHFQGPVMTSGYKL